MEEKNQETTGKTGLTNDSKVSLFLIGIALLLWIFAPFVNGDLYKITALEMLAGPIFKSWTWFTEAFYGKISYSEYIEVMSLTRQFWVAVAAVVYILLATVVCLRNNRRGAVVFSALGTVAFFVPMLELGIYAVTKDIEISESMMREFFSAFGWGYWVLIVIVVAIGVVNRSKEKK
jgi:hypothetical protein